MNQTDLNASNASFINLNDLAMSTIVNGVLIESRNIPLELQAVVNWVAQLVSMQVKTTCG